MPVSIMYLGPQGNIPINPNIPHYGGNDLNYNIHLAVRTVCIHDGEGCDCIEFINLSLCTNLCVDNQ